MTHTRSLLALPLFGLLLACPAEEPPLVGDDVIALRSGAWTLTVDDAGLEGRCEGLDPRDIVGSELDAWIRVDHREATVVIEDTYLEGSYDGRSLLVEGWVDPYGDEPHGEPDEGEVVVVEPDEDDDAGMDSGEDCSGGGSEADAPPPCETVEEPEESRPDEEGGVWIELALTASDAAHADGTLFLDYDMPGFVCELEAKVSAARDRRGDRPDHPYDDDPYDDDDDDHDEDVPLEDLPGDGEDHG